jgi:hypothetical protein
MKNFIFIICVSGLTLHAPLTGQDRLPKNNIGFSAGLIPAVNEIYVDEPLDFWPGREMSYMLQLSYARHFTEACLFGPYLEFEKVMYSVGADVRNLKRYNVGIGWLGKYPQRRLHMQLGGFVGVGQLRGSNWDVLWGSDAGMIAGPAFETRHLGAAIHFQIGHAWYESSGVPEGVMLYNPKFLIKMYAKF